MTGFPDYDAYDALGLAELVRTKQIEPIDLVEEAVARIDRVNPKINAVVHKLYDRARDAARGKLPDGPFRGVPLLLKDLLSALAGEPMSLGTRFYGDWAPPVSSELVERCLRAGLVVVGKTNTPEFGLVPTTEPLRFGAARNPWDLARTTGGSSGGSAAAVAARIVPMATGGDGGGSIRIPASCCGVFGLKPTRGRTPFGPLETEPWHGFVAEHVLTRSVRDSAAMLDALAGPNLGDSHFLPPPDKPFLPEVGAPPGKLRIAWCAEPFLPSQVHADCRKALEEAVALLGELGHEMVEAAPKIDGAGFARAFLIMIAGHVWADVRAAEERVGRKAGSGDFEPKTWLAHNMGAVFGAGEYVASCSLLQRMAREVHLFMRGYDAYLCPTVSRPPPPLGFLEPAGAQALVEKLAVALPLGGLMRLGSTVDDAAAEAFAFIPYTPVFNATGQPSMSVPLHWNDDGLPIGGMLSARFGDEATLLRLAGQLEEARPWRDRRPKVCA
jgi:amidase